jgi:prepilin-type N-terminal cleavage/methylation domain-containing protein
MNIQIKSLIQTTKLRRAFTLVEMLLVVTIIGILAALVTGFTFLVQSMS